jgi:HPt (histidine-containing phosphotransfer) domain-containing protein
MADVFGDDVATYLDLLQMMCDDNRPEDLAAATAPPIDRDALRRRMHKLRGSASMLGALGIAAHTTEIEAGCTAADMTDADLAAATAAVASELVQVSSGVAAARSRAGDGAAAAQPGAGAGSPADLQQLLGLLHDHDLSALDVVDHHSESLIARLGDTGYQTFVGLVHALKFADAAAMLAEDS